ncbi:unnamed protein product [Closterium sp. NIES-64]|nr:unnamed protein product [Closterium sp. NIES-64]
MGIEGRSETFEKVAADDGVRVGGGGGGELSFEGGGDGGEEDSEGATISNAPRCDISGVGGEADSVSGELGLVFTVAGSSTLVDALVIVVAQLAAKVVVEPQPHLGHPVECIIVDAPPPPSPPALPFSLHHPFPATTLFPPPPFSFHHPFPTTTLFPPPPFSRHHPFPTTTLFPPPPPSLSPPSPIPCLGHPVEYSRGRNAPQPSPYSSTCPHLSFSPSLLPLLLSGPNPALGHPVEYINVDAPQPAVCKYCGLRYLQDHSH